jgi:hypothetical protein
MKNSTKIILGAILVALLVEASYLLTHQDSSVQAISPAGTTGTSGKYYSQTISLATAAGTTTSMLNSSGQDLAMRAFDVMCQGVGTSLTAYSGAGLASLNFKAATSSINNVTNNVADINTKYMVNINVGTSTTDDYAATSTEGVIQGTSKIWPNGTYLIVSANATNTASCAVGVSAMPL